jgi:RES domain-containing protein
MRAWRILRPAYADDPLSGAGAARLGGRWNSVGVAMTYASTSRPLAVLEMLVHVRRERIPLDALLLPLEVPDDLITELRERPEGWNRIPHDESSRRAGDRWIRQGNSLAILVPSAVLPAERNLLINPAHPQVARVGIGEPERNAFDRRLFGMTK